MSKIKFFLILIISFFISFNLSYANQIIIKYIPNLSDEVREELNLDFNLNIIRPIPLIGAYLAEVSSHNFYKTLENLNSNPFVIYAEENRRLYMALTPNDPKFETQYALSKISAKEGWEFTTGSKNIIVGVIDTGVDYNHPDLKENIWVNEEELYGKSNIDDDRNGFVDDIYGYNFCDIDDNGKDDINPMDDVWHGTHVTGILGAVGNNGKGITGVNWNLSILPVKIICNDGTATLESAIRGIDYAIKNGAKILNASWGCYRNTIGYGGCDGFSQSLYNAIQEVGKLGIIFVAASGNNGVNNDLNNPFDPASFNLDNIISVASTDKSDNKSGFSNYGAVTVDLGAPGSDIVSTFPGGGYSTQSGTSMATPHVSGALALLLSIEPNLPKEFLIDSIFQGVDILPSLQGKTVTSGRLNLYKVLSPDTIPPSPIKDFLVKNVTFHSALLSWIAGGDDGDEGSATLYDLRISTFPITEENFYQAQQIKEIPHPKKAGEEENFNLTGLMSNTKYFVAIKTFDNRNNSSTISEVISFTTENATTIFSDDMESGNKKWQAQPPWTLSSGKLGNTTNYWTDSPTSNYENNLNSYIKTQINLTGVTEPILTFYTAYDFENGYDFGFIEASLDGQNWSLLSTLTGSLSQFTYKEVSLKKYAGKESLFLRFRIQTNNNYITKDGWYIDNVLVRGLGGNNLELDEDLDGFKVGEGDCNDKDANVNPSAFEICSDDKDSNCNLIDEECTLIINPQKEVTLHIGEKFLFTASGGTSPYYWKTTDEKVGIIDSKGIFTAVGEGVCYVLVKDSIGNFGISSKITVIKSGVCGLIYENNAFFFSIYLLILLPLINLFIKIRKNL